jgi:hypothetical protein
VHHESSSYVHKLWEWKEKIESATATVAIIINIIELLFEKYSRTTSKVIVASNSKGLLNLAH